MARKLVQHPRVPTQYIYNHNREDVRPLEAKTGKKNMRRIFLTELRWILEDLERFKVLRVGLKLGCSFNAGLQLDRVKPGGWKSGYNIATPRTVTNDFSVLG